MRLRDALRECNELFARRHITNPESRWVRRRSHALLIAHNMQNRDPTEHGVREMFLNTPSERTHASLPEGVTFDRERDLDAQEAEFELVPRDDEVH